MFNRKTRKGITGGRWYNRNLLPDHPSLTFDNENKTLKYIIPEYDDEDEEETYSNVPIVIYISLIEYLFL